MKREFDAEQQSCTSSDNIMLNTEEKMSKKRAKKEKIVKNNRDEDSGSDVDQDGLFLFSSSFIVGSSFIDIEINDPNQKDTILIGPNSEAKHRNKYLGYFGIRNITSQTVVAYYVYSNFKVGGVQKYMLNPSKGFLLPGQTQCIKVSKLIETKEDFEEVMNSHDLVFIKALPLDEKQVNSENIHKFEEDMDTIFHQYNIDLLFTLEVLSVEFVYDPVPYPDFENALTIEKKIIVDNIEQSGYQNIADEADEESEHMSVKQKNPTTSSNKSQMDRSTKAEFKIDKSGGLNTDKQYFKYEEKKEFHQTFGKVETPHPIMKRNTFIEDEFLNKEQLKSKQSSEVESLTENGNKSIKQNQVLSKKSSRTEEKETDSNKTGNNIIIDQMQNQNSSKQNISQKHQSIRADSHISEDFDEESHLIANKSLSKNMDDEDKQLLIQRSETKRNEFVSEESKEVNKSDSSMRLRTSNQNSAKVFPIGAKTKSGNAFGKERKNIESEGNNDLTTIDRKQIVYNAEHYDNMEKELSNLDISLNDPKYAEDSKFEGAMRLISMEMKLASFDKTQKKLNEILPTPQEIDEEHAQDQVKMVEDMFGS